MGLNERQIRAVMYVKEKGKITNKEYVTILPAVSRATATRDLTELLIRKGVLKKVGKGKREVHYILMMQK